MSKVSPEYIANSDEEVKTSKSQRGRRKANGSKNGNKITGKKRRKEAKGEEEQKKIQKTKVEEEEKVKELRKKGIEEKEEKLKEIKEERGKCIKELIFHEKKGNMWEYNPNEIEITRNFEDYKKRTEKEDEIKKEDEIEKKKQVERLLEDTTDEDDNMNNNIQIIPQNDLSLRITFKINNNNNIANNNNNDNNDNKLNMSDNNVDLIENNAKSNNIMEIEDDNNYINNKIIENNDNINTNKVENIDNNNNNININNNDNNNNNDKIDNNKNEKESTSLLNFLPDYDVLEKAKKDAIIYEKVAELKKNYKWSLEIIPRLTEPDQGKFHWDFLINEMIHVSNGIRRLRKRNLTEAQKIARLCRKRMNLEALKDERKEKQEKLQVKKIASQIAKQIKGFWQQIDKLVKKNQEFKKEEKLQEEREKQLEILVDQTEKYSTMLAKDLKSLHSSSKSSLSNLIQLNSNNNDDNNNNMNIDEDKNDNNNNDQMQVDDQKIPKKRKAKDFDAEDTAEDEEKKYRKDIITMAAEYAKKAQPTGTTLQTSQVKTKVPFLLKYPLREYQHIGLDWLVSMYDSKLNGILADEMGLGKTIMTISLLAHLACEKGIWGPHLIVVPTSVMLNWEKEIKRWCPAFKILTYFGTQKERKLKRSGWSRENSFHICITSYNLITKDKAIFMRKRWRYMILDEAQNIKNFQSQRWQVLLGFNTKRRLLLTGTPLQNNLMEVWSLMHFLMPDIFQSHSEFRDWFCNPMNNMIEGNISMNSQIISRLHGVLRPFILRRMKKDVEKQLPNKYEHIVPCGLSKRQRLLYDEFISRAGTKETLASGNYLSILNIIMQLRKVCNHPDLFEERSIQSPFFVDPIEYTCPGLIVDLQDQIDYSLKKVDLDVLNLKWIDPDDHSFLPLLYDQITPSYDQFEALFTDHNNSMKNSNNSLNNSNNSINNSNNSINNNNQLNNSLNDSNSSGGILFPNISHIFTTNKDNTRKLIQVIDNKLDNNNITNTTVMNNNDMNNNDINNSDINNNINNNLNNNNNNLNISNSNINIINNLNSSSDQNSMDNSSQSISNPSEIGSLGMSVDSQSSTIGHLLSDINTIEEEIRIGEDEEDFFENLENENDEFDYDIDVIDNTDLLDDQENTTNIRIKIRKNKKKNQVEKKGAKNLTPKKSKSKKKQQKRKKRKKNSDDEEDEESSSEGEFIDHKSPYTSMRSSQIDQSSSSLGDPSIYRPKRNVSYDFSLLKEFTLKEKEREMAWLRERKEEVIYINRFRTRRSSAMISQSLIKQLTIYQPIEQLHVIKKDARRYFEYSSELVKMITGWKDRIEEYEKVIEKFSCIWSVLTAGLIFLPSHLPPFLHSSRHLRHLATTSFLRPLTTRLRSPIICKHLSFPDKRLLQWDCGKLQTLAILLRQLKAGNHRALIFTQMTRMLDLLEIFLNLHGYKYMRLDGSTKPEQRQYLMDRFNADDRIFVFILSTRSGGFGINLIGADTVIFYDSDWNPAMDQQAQDRCHRIGQTREVHIYRLISEKTIEENILKKAKQKRLLDRVAIEGGNFTTEFFQSIDISSLVVNNNNINSGGDRMITAPINSTQQFNNISNEELVKAMEEVEDETDVAAMKKAQSELKAEQEEFTDKSSDVPFQLTPIQSYAYRVLDSGSENYYFTQQKKEVDNESNTSDSDQEEVSTPKKKKAKSDDEDDEELDSEDELN